MTISFAILGYLKLNKYYHTQQSFNSNLSLQLESCINQFYLYLLQILESEYISTIFYLFSEENGHQRYCKTRRKQLWTWRGTTCRPTSTGSGNRCTYTRRYREGDIPCKFSWYFLTLCKWRINCFFTIMIVTLLSMF